MSRSARRCQSCGSRTVSVERVRIVDVGRVRPLLCYTCGHTWATVEVDGALLDRALAGDIEAAGMVRRAVAREDPR